MDFLEIFLKWIVGPVVGVIITILLTEPLRDRLIPILTFIGSKKRYDITGVWRATFHFNSEEQKSFVEHIYLKYRMGVIVGVIVPSSDNYEALKGVEISRPLRVRGVLKDNLFFSGTWYHPIQRSHQSGTFDLLLNRSNNEMTGRWLGYSERRHEIESERWHWKRVDEDAISASTLSTTIAPPKEAVEIR